jgi:hypothetical protein
MRPQTSVTLAGLLLSSVAASGGELFRLGERVPRLASEDLGAIERVASSQGHPWALLSWRSQILPETWYADVFIDPAMRSGTLRRGQTVSLWCAPTVGRTACLQWLAKKGNGEYAQIADAAVFGDSLLPRTLREWPIRLVGEFSDEELESVVAYIRTSPKVDASPETAMVVDGSRPIRDIYREAAGVVRAWLTLADGIVQAVRFVRKKGVWQVVEIQDGVA